LKPLRCRGPRVSRHPLRGLRWSGSWREMAGHRDPSGPKATEAVRSACGGSGEAQVNST
jgi:hypothetical protein